MLLERCGEHSIIDGCGGPCVWFHYTKIMHGQFENKNNEPRSIDGVYVNPLEKGSRYFKLL